MSTPANFCNKVAKTAILAQIVCLVSFQFVGFVDFVVPLRGVFQHELQILFFQPSHSLHITPFNDCLLDILFYILKGSCMSIFEHELFHCLLLDFQSWHNLECRPFEMNCSSLPPEQLNQCTTLWLENCDLVFLQHSF